MKVNKRRNIFKSGTFISQGFENLESSEARGVGVGAADFCYKT